jgi:hypothetical protein
MEKDMKYAKKMEDINLLIRHLYSSVKEYNDHIDEVFGRRKEQRGHTVPNYWSDTNSNLGIVVRKRTDKRAPQCFYKLSDINLI